MAIKYIGSVKSVQAENQVKEIYKELKDDMGDVVEPISLHALNPDLLEGIWHILREVVIIDNKLTRIEKEAIGATVSESNKCGYCVDAHTIMLIGLKDKQTANAIVKNDPSMIGEINLRNLVKWAFNTKKFDSVIVKFPPFVKDSAPEAIGTAVFFHYLNRMVFAFLGPTILPVNINFLKGSMKKMAGMMFSSVLAKERTYKDFKTDQLKADNTLEEKLRWTTSNSQINYVYLKFYKTLNNLAIHYIPEDVRNFIRDYISKWNGVDLFLIDELDSIVTPIKEEHRELVKVLYLQAFSPFKINKDHIDVLKDFYSENQEEAILVSFAWVSFEISLQIGSKLGKKFSV